jgi:hypothetical protein
VGVGAVVLVVVSVVVCLVVGHLAHVGVAVAVCCGGQKGRGRVRGCGVSSVCVVEMGVSMAVCGVR